MENVLLNKGNKKFKDKLKAKIDKPIFAKYEKQNPAWKEIHAKYFKIAKEETTLGQSFNLLIEIQLSMLQLYEEGSIEEKDLHFAQEILDKLLFIYGEDVIDLKDGEIYGQLEVVDEGLKKEDIPKVREDLKKLKKQIKI